MADSAWRPIGRNHQVSLVEARLVAHVAVQWLARAARAYIAPQSDYSHTSLTWDEDLGRLCTQPIAPDGTRMALALVPLAVEIRGRGESRLALEGRTDNDVSGWLAQELANHGLDAAKLDRYYPDDLVGQSVQSGGAYGGELWRTAERELSNWFANAAPLLSAVAARHRDIEPGPSPVRCWPHHFDMATLIQLDDGEPESVRSVGVGFSPGDQSYAEPYFYVTPWPYPGVPSLPAIGELGHWHRDGFVAAIAPADRILASDQQAMAVADFLAQAVTACMDLLAFDPS